MSSFRIWFLATTATVAAGVAVPYALLSGGPASHDVFVFWCLFGGAVVVLILAGMAGWRR